MRAQGCAGTWSRDGPAQSMWAEPGSCTHNQPPAPVGVPDAPTYPPSRIDALSGSAVLRGPASGGGGGVTCAVCMACVHTFCMCVSLGSSHPPAGGPRGLGLGHSMSPPSASSLSRVAPPGVGAGLVLWEPVGQWGWHLQNPPGTLWGQPCTTKQHMVMSHGCRVTGGPWPRWLVGSCVSLTQGECGS